jgi:hypothetical protein
LILLYLAVIYDAEFELWTKMLFDRIIEGRYRIIYSELTNIELTYAPERVKSLIRKLPNQAVDVIKNSIEATSLADTYIHEKVVGKTSLPDRNHIALATLNDADILVSWNFKHIVNVNRIRGYNAVNIKLGHKILEIRSPREILEYED